MLYIDFGPHPGRDRLPREAAMGGACVITGMRGSAANNVDVGLPSAFKIDETQPNFNEAFRHQVDRVMSDFGTAQTQLSDYRQAVAHDQDRFRRQIGEIFFKPTPAR